MKQTLEEAVNEIGGVHPDWDNRVIKHARVNHTLE